MGIPASKLSDNRTILIVYFTQLWLVIIRYAAYMTRAGWSSPVARQAHNLKVVGSNPTPATNPLKYPPKRRVFFVGNVQKKRALLARSFMRTN